MKYCDFLSSSPTIYLLNQTKGKSKLGGFLSIIYVLVMIGISIYYFYLYFSGQKFELKYRTDNLRTYPENKQRFIHSQQIQIYILINKKNIYSELKYELFNKNKYYDESNLTRCENHFIKNFEGDTFCFNTNFFGNYFSIKCKDNCTDLNGKPYELSFSVITQNLKINHDEKNPFEFSHEIGETFFANTKSNFFQNHFLLWTPVIYNTTKIFSREREESLNFYINDIINRIQSKDIDDDIMAQLYFDLSINCDIYDRIYITLIDTISAIGGLFSPVKICFATLIMFYSDFENNYRITEKVILKKNTYQNFAKSKNKLDDYNVKSIEFNEKKLLEKKIRTRSCEHFFCSFFNCGKNKNRKTMKILNTCNDFVMKYLSAENIIFNNILFEKFYEENYIDISKIKILCDIENEMFNHDDNNELLLSDFNGNT